MVLSHSTYRKILQAVLLTTTASQLFAAETLFQEGFNTDGDGARYTVEGGGAYERSEVTWRADQDGPLIWARSSEISFVGVPGATPARRALLTYHHTIDPSQVTENFWEIFDATVSWLTKGKTTGTVLFSADPTINVGDAALADRLTAAGWTVQVDPGGSEPRPGPQGIDLVIKTSSGDGGNPGRFSNYPVPVLIYNAADLDDELVSTIGQSSQNFEMSNITIQGSHPAVGGLTGSVPVVTGAANFDIIGDILPERAVTAATFTRQIPFVLDTLAEVDNVFNGTLASSSVTGTIPSLDISDSSFGTFSGDNPLPDGAADVYALKGTGKLNVTRAGTYRFALGVDDGGRLRIDLDRNGLTAADQVITLDSTGALRFAMANVTFATTGVYDFEAVSFDQGGISGLEVAYSTDTAAPDPLTDNTAWQLLDSAVDTGDVKLQGNVSLTVYSPDVPSTQETRPYLVLLEEGSAGGLVLSGGPFVDFEGSAFFAGAALNKGDDVNFVMPASGYRSIKFNPINVAGKQNVKLKMLVAGTFLDFETSDYFDVVIDPDADGPKPEQTLVHFTAPSGSDKYFDDRSTNPGDPTRLGLRFQEITYDIPSDATQLAIEIRAFTTWWNEIVAFDNIRVVAGAEENPSTSPTISISKVGNSPVITFTGSLEMTDKLPATTWTPVTSGSPYTVPAGSKAAFFRSKQQ